MKVWQELERERERVSKPIRSFSGSLIIGEGERSLNATTFSHSGRGRE